MTRYGVPLLGIAEARMPDSGRTSFVVDSLQSPGNVVLFSGHPSDSPLKGQHGVALALRKEFSDALISFSPHGPRLLSARFRHQHGKLTVVVAYAPHDEHVAATKDSFYVELNSVLLGIPAVDTLVVLGDFNAELGGDWQSWPDVLGRFGCLGEVTDNGSRLLQLCSSAGLCVLGSLFRRKFIHRVTYEKGTPFRRRQLLQRQTVGAAPQRGKSNELIRFAELDHILVRSRQRSMVSQFRAWRGAVLSSPPDHFLITATIRLTPRAIFRPKRMRRVHGADLRLCKDAFELALHNRFDALGLLNDIERTHPAVFDGDVDHLYVGFKEAVVAAASDAVSKLPSRPRFAWTSARTLEIVAQQRAARVAKDAAGERRLAASRKVSMEQDVERHFEAMAARVDAAMKRNDLRPAFQELRRLQARTLHHKSSTVFLDSAGRAHSEPHECAEVCAAYWEQLLNADPPPHLPPPPPPDEPDDDIVPVSLVEVQQALHRLKNNSAPGVCGVTAEMLKLGGERLARWMQSIINAVFVQERLPDDWTRGILLPLYKNKGDRRECKNYRGITLLSVPGKLFAIVLLQRNIELLRATRRPQQAGFMPDRSTTEAIFALRQIIEKRLEFGRPFYCAFVDFLKAFDSVCREALWRRMAELGVPSRDLRLFRLLYSATTSSVRVDDVLSRSFLLRSGVRQGCCIAPELFNVVMDAIMSRTIARVGNIFHVGATAFSDLCYADDVALLADSEDELRRALEVLAEEAKKFGLLVNWDKTKIALFGAPFPYEPQDWHPPLVPPRPRRLHVGNNSSEFVDSFVYLGGSLKIDNNVRADVDRRIGLASGAMAALDHALWQRPSICLQTKLRVYHALVLSLLLYGAETWSLPVALSDRLASFHTQSLRRILGLRWDDFTRNEDVLRRCDSHDLRAILAFRRLRWFGHVARLPPERPARGALLARPSAAQGWRRPAGRPRLRWHEAIDTSLRSIHDAASGALRHPRPAGAHGHRLRDRSDRDLIPVSGDLALSGGVVHNRLLWRCISWRSLKDVALPVGIG